MHSLLHASVSACQTKTAAREIPAVPFIYGQTVFDLSLVSCRYEPELKAQSRAFANVIDGRFQVKNRTTGDKTRFRVAYGASGELRGVHVRAVFRPRWWMEVELLLDRPTGDLTSMAPKSMAGRLLDVHRSR